MHQVGRSLNVLLISLISCFLNVGDVYISATQNHVIVKVSSGVITIVAGTDSSSGFDGDGQPATSAELQEPYGIALDSAGSQ